MVLTKYVYTDEGGLNWLPSLAYMEKIMFHDRRRSPSVDIPLTKRQREIFESENKSLSVASHDQLAFLQSLHVMKQNGDKAIDNLDAKARQAIIEANPDPCQRCLGSGCGQCAGTGRWLDGT